MPPTKPIYQPEQFADDLTRVIASSRLAKKIRACLVTTHDRDHAMTTIKNVVMEAGRPLYHFTISGKRRWNVEKVCWEEIGSGNVDAAELLRSAQELRGGGVVQMEDIVPFLRDENGDLRARDRLRSMLSVETRNDGLVLAFVEPPEAEAALPSILADRFVRLEIPFPRLPDLNVIAREEITKILSMSRQPLDANSIRETAERLGSVLVGLTRSAARDGMQDALAPDHHDFEAAYERLQIRKTLKLSRELSMRVLDTTNADIPLGLDYLVDYLQMQKAHMRESGPGRSRGILLIGPPGTGKTMLARAIGLVVGLPVVEFCISSLMNSHLGETENRFVHAFATLEAMAPNVVFIDEIEKAFSEGAERDGGTMMRATGSLLSWLSDNPYPNFIVATSNNLKRMGEIGLTMTRSERFDASFFVDVPNFEVRKQMFQQWLGNVLPKSGKAAEELATLTEKFSGADIRSLIKKGSTRSAQNEASVTLDSFKAEIERMRLRAVAFYDDFQALRRWGRMYCEPAGPTDG